MADGFEIERKYLIRFPEREILESCGTRYSIEQIYLLDDGSGYSSRIRKREFEGKTEYFHTRKQHVTDIRRVELECLIPAEEYQLLRLSADPKRSIIYKTRYCLESGGKLFEIDVYPFWNDRAVMEIELSDEDDTFDIPEGISVIKEITSDKRYTNSSIAKKIPQDDIQE